MIETDRLILRPYDEARDRAALRALSDDPQVMRYLLPEPDDAAFDAMVARMEGYRLDRGFTFWAVERRSDGATLGVCGLKPGAPGTPIEHDIEIGWRFGRGHWGKGYAREAAQASLDWAWGHTDAEHIVAITVEQNRASWTLMERLGMTRVAGADFDHPKVPDDSALKRHILYRINRPSRD